MITIFTTETCPRCKILKEKLKSKNIEYKENQNITDMKKLGIMSVPYLMINDELIDFGKAISWVNKQ